MSQLELKIPPVGMFLLFLFALLGLQALTPGHEISPAFRVLAGLALLAASGVFGITGILHFKRAGTSVHPLEPERSSVLVTHGVYAISRNPMYLALLLALLAYGFFMSNGYCIAFAVLFVPVMNRFQIIPEERVLAERFGEAFTAYCRETGRWI
jgi:protein-S-isoprenylcysteine O-methyltransferase Ste14